MTTPNDLAARLFVRVYTTLLDDEDVLELSYAAVGVYVVALLISKQTASDGRVWVKLLRRDSAMRPGPPLEECLDELAGAGLVTLDGEVVIVRSWAKYNALAAQIVAKMDARKAAARRAAHERWHDGPFHECQRCNPDVPPDQCESDAAAYASVDERNAQRHRHRHRHSHSDPAASDPASTDIDADDVALADQLIDTLGYFDQPSTTGEQRYVARALRRGWTPDQLVDVAHEAAGRTDIDDTRQYLLGCLRRRSNNDPDQPSTPPATTPVNDNTDAFPDPHAGWDTPDVTADGIADARAQLNRDHP